ncbi:hypothetical protein [Polynucleobacter asymbioticus]|uniref:Peptidase M41 domain-containing protein n=1 Tax=Polynucleobacter asymbioticus TaxID=576611 RepID=A0AAC9NGR8_9BURK|nr:hypothetical protein [Polynucleobacter asymbioticus]APB97891.1 hypothetical protein A4F89_00275 [Polynucleobacter asymbioticus]APC00176.1 hypothetical protein AOC25_00275 [Polynucleobacter asymbioticus]
MEQHLESITEAQISTALTLKARYAVLNNWVEDLKKVAQNPGDQKISLLTGRAAMIECPDVSACRQVLPKIAQMANMQYLTMTPDETLSWLSGEQDGLDPMKSNPSGTPTLACLPMECFIKADEKSDQNQFGWDVPSWLNLSKLLRAANIDAPLIIVVIGKRFLDLSEELRSAYGFDRHFAIPKASPLERYEDFLEEVDPEWFDKSITEFPEKVGTLITIAFPDKRRLGLLSMGVKRLSMREDRVVSYKDLVTFSARGTGDIAPWPHLNEKNLYRTAVHEAGHALIAMLDSNGANVPDYVSISPGKGFLGVTIESYGYLYQELGCDAYKNGRHSVRVALGGRAAEELILGVEQIGTSGLRSDLEEISGNVRGFFAVHGICVDIEEAQHTGVNLAAVINGESASEAAHIEPLMRAYIERQYRNTLDQMRANQTLLDAIIKLLMKNRDIYQDDLLSILADHRSALINPVALAA